MFCCCCRCCKTNEWLMAWVVSRFAWYHSAYIVNSIIMTALLSRIAHWQSVVQCRLFSTHSSIYSSSIENAEQKSNTLSHKHMLARSLTHSKWINQVSKISNWLRTRQCVSVFFFIKIKYGIHMWWLHTYMHAPASSLVIAEYISHAKEEEHAKYIYKQSFSFAWKICA